MRINNSYIYCRSIWKLLPPFRIIRCSTFFFLNRMYRDAFYALPVWPEYTCNNIIWTFQGYEELDSPDLMTFGVLPNIVVLRTVHARILKHTGSTANSKYIFYSVCTPSKCSYISLQREYFLIGSLTVTVQIAGSSGEEHAWSITALALRSLLMSINCFLLNPL